MLPVEKAQGQIFLNEKFLCEVEYEISEPLQLFSKPQVQRVLLNVPDERCATLLDSYDLILVLVDGDQHHIPRPIRHFGQTHLECYVET